MFADPMDWEKSTYQTVVSSSFIIRYRELMERGTVWIRRVTVVLLLGLSGLLIWLMATWFSWIGITAFVGAMFLVAAHHEWGHYVPMTKAGVTPVKVGMGIFEGPFRHLQFKFNPKWLPGDCEFWFSPATFMIAAYVDEGEEGMKQIMEQDRKTRAEIFGGGITNNLILALFSWSIIQLHQWDGTNGVWPVLAALGIGLLVTAFITDEFRLSPTKLNYLLGVLALATFVYAVVVGSIWNIPAPVWALFCAGMMIFLLEYRPVVTSRFFPLLGLGFALFLAWNIVPNIASDVGYAITHGGAASGENAEMLGPRSLFELYAISGSEPSAHIVEQIGTWNAAAYVWLSKQWIFVVYMIFLLSTGLALTNLLPVKELDGGYLWQDFLDPNKKYPRWRKWGLLIPTIPILSTIVIILIATELGSLRWLGFTVLGLYLATKVVRWRVRLIRESLKPSSQSYS